MGERPHEICAACGDATGHAGYGEDSIGYVDGMIGPLCEECNERLRLEIVVDEPIELALREQVREVELENMALAEQLATCRALLRETWGALCGEKIPPRAWAEKVLEQITASAAVGGDE